MFKLSLLILAVGFVAVTSWVIAVPHGSFDLAISLAVQSIDLGFLPALMTLVSWPGFFPQSLIISVCIIVAFFVAGYRRESVFLLLNGVAIQALTIAIKALIHRPRPSPDMVAVVTLLSDYSFPSGHVLLYCGFFGFVCFLVWSVRKPSVIRSLALGFLVIEIGLVGISRVYLGAHWASDVIGGYLLGAICLIVSIHFYRSSKALFGSGRLA
ncbi:MAG: phosphatase PAP2 family protein [Phycisphaerae bacterium]|nr:phosphatase PAP2 family protein [Saprospiraceae bacterium]